MTMQPLAFLGGAIVGAAGLAAAAYVDHRITEAKFSPDLKRADTLNAEQVVRELNSYFFKVQGIYSKCNKIVLENSELVVTPMPLPHDNIIHRVANSIGGRLASISRGSSISQLLECQREANKLHGRYLGVFERANSILTEKGMTPFTLTKRLFTDKTVALDTSIRNEDWDTEFETIADNIRDTLDEACNHTERLIAMLEQTDVNCALEA